MLLVVPAMQAYLQRSNPNRSDNMGNVKSIEKAVESLQPSELAEFRRWFAEFDAATWDRQIRARCFCRQA